MQGTSGAVDLMVHTAAFGLVHWVLAEISSACLLLDGFGVPVVFSKASAVCPAPINTLFFDSGMRQLSVWTVCPIACHDAFNTVGDKRSLQSM